MHIDLLECENNLKCTLICCFQMKINGHLKLQRFKQKLHSRSRVAKCNEASNQLIRWIVANSRARTLNMHGCIVPRKRRAQPQWNLCCFVFSNWKWAQRAIRGGSERRWGGNRTIEITALKWAWNDYFWLPRIDSREWPLNGTKNVQNFRKHWEFLSSSAKMSRFHFFYKLMNYICFAINNTNSNKKLLSMP